MKRARGDRASPSAARARRPSAAPGSLLTALGLLAAACAPPADILDAGASADAGTRTPEQIAAESPFGVFGPFVTLREDPGPLPSRAQIDEWLGELGVSWVQELYADSAALTTQVASRVGAEGGPTLDPTAAYLAALRQAIAQHKGRIKYWEVGTEPSGFPPPQGWAGDPARYVHFLVESSKVIKAECPDCQVVFGGLSGVGAGYDESFPSAVFLKEALDLGAAEAFDVFEFKQHAVSAGGYAELRTRMKVFSRLLGAKGLHIERGDPGGPHTPVFVETAMYARCASPTRCRRRAQAETWSAPRRGFRWPSCRSTAAERRCRPALARSSSSQSPDRRHQARGLQAMRLPP